MPAIYLKPGREKSLLRRHPWIFSGAIGSVEGELASGQTVDVFGSDGDFLARGAYSPASQIRVRIWTWDREERIDPHFFRERLCQAIKARKELIDLDRTNAYRLVYAESDRLPGLIVDRYADVLVIQSLSSGVECWLDTIVDALVEITGSQQVLERSDVEVRKLEGLSLRKGWLRRTRSGIGTAGEAPDQSLMSQIIRENDFNYWVDLIGGHKTGFYLDQRVNRDYVQNIAHDREVLDCFCYTGGFVLSALTGGAASVVAVDSSSDALNLAKQNIVLNGVDPAKVEWVEGDVFQVLRRFRDEGRSFDMVVLDPPKFAPTVAQAKQAARGYKDINLLGFKLLRPGGILVTFSCSGGVNEELFQKIVAGAALDAQVDAQILERLHQGPDHPVALNFPEGAYLKGLVCRVAG
jgi:23S rRNA (cytosine1962-C5)-methyltransferase